jgi:ABC-type multidrug transport system fused ATPase/permease subunit
MYYAPSWFLKEFVEYLEAHPDRSDMRWGWVWSFALFASNALMFLAIGVLWSISSTHLQTRIKLQLYTLLFSKTLVKKDLASAPAAEKKITEESLSLAVPGEDIPGAGNEGQDREGAIEERKAENKEPEEEDVSSKAQVMTLFQIDCERISEWTFHAFSMVDAPIEILVGGLFLYRLVGISAVYGLLASLITLPLNQFASKYVVHTQEQLMKARDKRTSLMNEVLGAIRMLKFMAWERKYEARVSDIRNEELKWLKRNYMIEVLFTFVWSVTPIVCIIVTFGHYSLIAKHPLTPGIAFPAVSVLNELRFSLATIPETVLNAIQGFVSLRRVEKYMSTAEVSHRELGSTQISMRSATITWPRDIAPDSAGPASLPSTPKVSFTLTDLNLDFPQDGLSLICGRLGSGKTLLLLGLLGEADVLAGQVVCPRSGPGAIEDFGKKISREDWVVKGRTAYCPQQAWLQNDTIRGNILFGCEYVEERYRAVIEACSLVSDLAILEDGSETEIGEKGVNLSGGQRSRVSLARAGRSHIIAP